MRVSRKASAEEIKRSFRKLAHAYHPDKNPENHLITNYFQEIFEAYSVLISPKLRREYDVKLMQSGRGEQESKFVSSDAILLELKKLNGFVSGPQRNQVNKDLLAAYLKFLFRENHRAMLKKEAKPTDLQEFITCTLEILAHLDWAPFTEIKEPLIQLAQDDEVTIGLIHLAQRKKRKEHLLRRMVPFLAIVFTILLCIGMFFYSKR